MLQPIGFWLYSGLLGTIAFSPRNPCTDPGAPRVGITIRDTNPTSPLMEQIAKAESNLREELVKLQSPGTCVLRDEQSFSDANNFPHLKGTVVFHINAVPSFTNVETFAVAVDVRTVQGILIEQNRHITTQAVLVENARDYSIGARTVMMAYDFMANLLSSQLGKACEAEKR